MYTQAVKRDPRLAHPRQVSLHQLARLAIGALMVLWAGSYWHGHLGDMHLLVSGVVVHLYGLGVLISSVLEIAGVSRARETSERVLLLSGFVVWIPVVLIALRAIGIDLWNASPAFVLANLAGSIGLGLLVAWKLATRK